MPTCSVSVETDKQVVQQFVRESSATWHPTPECDKSVVLSFSRLYPWWTDRNHTFDTFLHRWKPSNPLSGTPRRPSLIRVKSHQSLRLRFHFHLPLEGIAGLVRQTLRRHPRLLKAPPSEIGIYLVTLHKIKKHKLNITWYISDSKSILRVQINTELFNLL